MKLLRGRINSMKLVLKFLFNILNKIRFPNQNGIVFIHKSPKVFNIGDYLCSPRHYFEFKKPIKNLTIIGGGVFSNLGIDFLKKNYIDLNKTILWGVGNSKKDFLYKSQQVKKLPYLAWGIRDKESVIQEFFLPCVSCLHPMLNERILGSRTLLFLNKNSKISSSEYMQEFDNLAKKRNWNLLFNDCSEEEIKEALIQHKYIITNSYHGAYWALLSGHEIMLLGYNPKFISVLKLFDFDESELIRYKKGDGKDLLDRISAITDNKKFIKLNNHTDVLNEFRNINLDFANALKDKNIIDDYEYKFQKRDLHC